MVGRDLGSDIDEVLGGNPELGELPLRLYRGLGEMAAHRLWRVLDLAQPDPELKGRIAVLLVGTLSHDLAIVELEDGYAHLLASLREEAGHADLLSDHSGTHRACP